MRGGLEQHIELAYQISFQRASPSRVCALLLKPRLGPVGGARSERLPAAPQEQLFWPPSHAFASDTRTPHVPIAAGRTSRRRRALQPRKTFQIPFRLVPLSGCAVPVSIHFEYPCELLHSTARGHVRRAGVRGGTRGSPTTRVMRRRACSSGGTASWARRPRAGGARAAWILERRKMATVAQAGGSTTCCHWGLSG
eukprot:scaffold18065_cov59-Phaeocystis_antarctica.AAC.7